MLKDREKSSVFPLSFLVYDHMYDHEIKKFTSNFWTLLLCTFCNIS